MRPLSESIIRQHLSATNRDYERAALAHQRALEKEQRRIARIEERKTAFLGDPLKLDSYVAGITNLLSPSTKKPKYAKYATKTEAVVANIPEDHPMASFASDFSSRFVTALQDTANVGRTPEEIGKSLAENMYSGEKDPLSGRTRYHSSLTYKARKDHSLMRALGIFGEDKNIKKPVGYDEYIKAVENTPAEDVSTSFGTVLTTSAGMAAAWRGSIHLLAKSRIPLLAARAGAAVAKAPHPVAKAVGLGLSLAGGWLTYEAFENALNRTIYGKTHEEFKWTKPSTWDKEALELGATILTGSLAKKGSVKALSKLVEKDAIHNTLLKQLEKFPTAKNAIAVGRAQRAVAKATAKTASVEKDVVYDAVKNAQDHPENIAQRSPLKTPDPIVYGTTYRPPTVEDLYKKIGHTKPKPVDIFIGEEGLTTIVKAKGSKVFIDETGVVGIKTRKATKQEVDAVKRLFVKEVPPAAKEAGDPKKIFTKLDPDETDLVLKRSEIYGIDTAVLDLQHGKKVAKEVVKQERKTVIPKEPDHVAGIEAFSTAQVEVKKEPVSFTQKAAYVVEPKPGKVLPTVVRSVTKKEPATKKAISYTQYNNIITEELENIGLADETIDFVFDVMFAGGDKLESVIFKAVDENKLRGVIAKIVGQLGSEPKQVAESFFTKGISSPAKVKIKKHKLTKEQLEIKRTLAKALLAKDKKVKAKASKWIAARKDMDDYFSATERDPYMGEGLSYEAKEDLVTGFNKWTFAITGSIGLVGVSAMFPESSEAFSLKSLVPNIFQKEALNLAEEGGEKLVKKYLNELIDETLVALPVNGSKTLPAPMLSKKNAFNTAELATKRFGSIVQTVRRTKGLSLFADRFMSTPGFGKLFFKAGGSPAIELGVRHIATGKNIDNAFQVAENILSSVPGINKYKVKDVIKQFEPLAKKYQTDVVSLGAADFQIKQLKTTVDKLTKTLNKKKIKKSKLKEHKFALKRAQEKLKELVPVRNELEQKFKAFDSVWSDQVKKLAAVNPSTRIALAAEDTAEFTIYPWLKDIITKEEKEAVGYIKAMMHSYKVRARDAGLSVIENRPYMHHALHPTWSEKKMLENIQKLGLDVGVGTPMTKFWHRSTYSRMLVPDINYTLQRYIPDAESRIQWSSFWGKGKKNSWWALANSSLVQNSSPLRAFFNRLKEAAIPESQTTWNTWANRYAAIEVFRLLAASPSVAFKHAFKLTGTWSNLGFTSAARHLPETFTISVKNLGANKMLGKKLEDFGIDKLKDIKYSKRLAVQTYSYQSRQLSNMMDMDLPGRATKGFDEFLRKANEKGGTFVRAVESFDRAHSFLAALDMAAKKGMTTKDAMYGIMETILVNNFLSGALNPKWMKDPKIRAMLLFQNTPFKLLERRLLGAHATVRLGKKIIDLRKVDKAAFRKELQQLKQYIFEGQDAFKHSQIMEAVKSERDFMGTNVVSAFMKEMMLMGLMFTGGANLLGWNLKPQLFHLPFLRHDTVQPTLVVSPIIQGALETKADVIRSHAEAEETEFFVTSFMRNWLGRGRGLPVTVHKLLRLSENDIPARYRDSTFPGFQYLFAIPGYGKH